MPDTDKKIAAGFLGSGVGLVREDDPRAFVQETLPENGSVTCALCALCGADPGPEPHRREPETGDTGLYCDACWQERFEEIAYPDFPAQLRAQARAHRGILHWFRRSPYGLGPVPAAAAAPAAAAPVKKEGRKPSCSR